jgi:hypothetical protein
MDILSYNICKINMLLLMIIVPALLAGQSETIDSTSNNFVTNDTIIGENILKTPELQVEKIPEKEFSAPPMIPMPVPEMSGQRRPDLLMSMRYPRYESIKGISKYTELEYDANLNLNFPSQIFLYRRGISERTLNLNLNFAPPKSLLDMISENPLRLLLMLAGMMNNHVVGEDKMNQIRLNNMVQSRSGIPETAISGNGAVYFEIDVKRKKY